MLNLQKYLKKAEIDPDFKEKLLKDAKQAIKEEFGEKIPYRLTCHKKIVFEVEPIQGLSDEKLSRIAGGNDQVNKRAPSPYGVPAYGNPCVNAKPQPAPEFPNKCPVPEWTPGSPNRCWVPEWTVPFLAENYKPPEK